MVSSLLLATKTYLPQPRAGWVRRARLIEIVNRALQNGRRLVLLSSAAGSGKSTLISDWAGQSQSVVAWLALDGQDNDPAVFWAYVIAAFQRRFPDFAKTIQAGLLSPQPPPVDVVLPELLNQIAELHEPLVLVLDDYHLIQQQAIHDSLVFLIEHAPENFLLILSTRVDPPMPLSRWRARAQLTEIRAADLRFQDQEAADFLDRFMGLGLDEEDISQLSARTEGWAAGLQLAALAMQGLSTQEQPDLKGFIAKFSASHQYILDYLTNEVLAQQPDEVQNFLVETSILSQLNASLCNAVLQIQNSGEILDTLQRQNLFVISLDDERNSYRYHHLFAELLQIRFARIRKEARSGLHQRAAQWYDAHGNVDEAIRHALSAGQQNYAAEVVSRSWRKATDAGQLKMAQRWLQALPRELIMNSPLLGNALGWVMALTGKTQEAAALAEQVDRLLEEMEGQGAFPADQPEYAYLPGQVAALHSLLAVRSGSAQGIIEWAQKSIRLSMPDDHFSQGSAYMMLAAAYRQHGQLEEAVDALYNAIPKIKASKNDMMANLSTYQLGRLLINQGRLRQASQLFETALAEELEQADYPSIEALLLGLAMVRYEQNQLEQVEGLLSRMQALNRRGGSHDVLKHSLPLRAQVCLARGDAPAALVIAEELQVISRQDPFFGAPAQAFQAWMQVRNQQLDAARGWLETVDARLEGHPGVARMSALFFLARVLLALQNTDQALTLLEGMSAAAQASRSYGWQVEISILQALAYAQKGEAGRAVETLTSSIDLAQPEGFIRAFLDEGEPLQQLLRQLLPKLSKGAQQAFVESLLAAFPAGPADDAPASPELAAGYEPLSQRELEVLQLLAQGLSNNEIAARLYVSLATVKTHLIHIFGKLNVQNRVEATNRAKELNLV